MCGCGLCTVASVVSGNLRVFLAHSIPAERMAEVEDELRMYSSLLRGEGKAIPARQERQEYKTTSDISRHA